MCSKVGSGIGLVNDGLWLTFRPGLFRNNVFVKFYKLDEFCYCTIVGYGYATMIKNKRFCL